MAMKTGPPEDGRKIAISFVAPLPLRPVLSPIFQPAGRLMQSLTRRNLIRAAEILPLARIEDRSTRELSSIRPRLLLRFLFSLRLRFFEAVLGADLLENCREDIGQHLDGLF